MARLGGWRMRTFLKTMRDGSAYRYRSHVQADGRGIKPSGSHKSGGPALDVNVLATLSLIIVDPANSNLIWTI